MSISRGSFLHHIFPGWRIAFFWRRERRWHMFVIWCYVTWQDFWGMGEGWKALAETKRSVYLSSAGRDSLWFRLPWIQIGESDVHSRCCQLRGPSAWLNLLLLLFPWLKLQTSQDMTISLIGSTALKYCLLEYLLSGTSFLKNETEISGPKESEGHFISFPNVLGTGC